MTEQLTLAETRPDPARPMEGRRHRETTDTERAASLRMMPRSGTQRYNVLWALRTAARYDDGATDYELWRGRWWRSVGARPHVPATRREELIRDGWPIVDSGFRRPTDTGSPAIVWRLEE